MNGTVSMPTLPDLLYPDRESKEQLRKRRIQLDGLPDSYINDIQAERLSRYFSPHSFQFSLNIFKELCTDERVINYRLDIIEDLLTHPRLAAVIRSVIGNILDNNRNNMKDAGAPDSFAALSARIDSLDLFIGETEKAAAYFEGEGRTVKSAALKGVEDYFLSVKSSDSFSELKADTKSLKEAFSARIRSVTVAINFNEEMRPVSAGIVSVSDTHASEKPSLFDRILYRRAKYADINVSKLHTKFIGDTKDPSDIDKKLFEELEKIASGYLSDLESAMNSYLDIDLSGLGVLVQQLDFLEKGAELVRLAEAKGLKMCRPVILPMSDRRMRCRGLFDINLFRSAVAAKPDKKGDELIIANDLELNDETGFYLLSGANNGGKTTFVRAAGLCQLFAQAGLYVPCGECEISPVDCIFTHFPKEEEVGINTSRFTEEVKDLKRIAENITEYSLLFMNESIQSTTPAECLDIAEEFVRIFTIIGARGIFATHLAELAKRIDSINSDPDCRSKTGSLTVTVNEETGERIYRIVKAMPSGSSYAYSILKQFGISADEVRRRSKK